jgi:hypothetical protein
MLRGELSDVSGYMLRRILSLVTTGLDPVVHGEVRLTMDCRIKSGNDEW